MGRIFLRERRHRRGNRRRSSTPSPFFPTPFATKPKDLIQIRFTDDKTGWIVGERGVVYRTEDAGFHWVQYPGAAGVSLYGLSFPDASRGWASGERGTILRVTTTPTS